MVQKSHRPAFQGVRQSQSRLPAGVSPPRVDAETRRRISALFGKVPKGDSRISKGRAEPFRQRGVHVRILPYKTDPG